MHGLRRLILAACLVLALAACESAPVKGVKSLFQPSKGEPALSLGVKQYEDGSYGDAVRNLQQSLDQGLSTEEQVKAHKYLAFTYCVTSRERQCRDEFRKALDLNPALELTPAEAGHPLWGPVFRAVKAARK
jgi:Tfp pilus assembly protein PilF